MKNATNTAARKATPAITAALGLTAPAAATAAATPVNSAIAQFVAATATVPAAPAVTPLTTQQIALMQTDDFKATLAFALTQRAPVVKKERVAKTPRTPRAMQNGIKAPTSGITAQIWDVLNNITATQGYPASIAQLRAALPCNAATQQTQYAQWRKYNSINGRIATPAAPNAVLVTVVKPTN